MLKRNVINNLANGCDLCGATLFFFLTPFRQATWSQRVYARRFLCHRFCGRAVMGRDTDSLSLGWVRLRGRDEAVARLP